MRNIRQLILLNRDLIENTQRVGKQPTLFFSNKFNLTKKYKDKWEYWDYNKNVLSANT